MKRGRALVLVFALAGLGGLGCVAVVPRSEPPPGKVVLCHKGKTLTVAEPAVAAHRRHGDTLGRCR